MSLLKSVDRAVDKTARSYKNDAYMLLDVVRQCIVVDDVGDMLVAMQQLQQACMLQSQMFRVAAWSMRGAHF